MSRSLRSHRLHYRRKGAALDRLNHAGRLFAQRLCSKYAVLQKQMNALPLLRRLILALMAILCVALVALAFAIRASNHRELSDAEIWHNAVRQNEADAKELPDIQKLPERRYVNEQI